MNSNTYNSRTISWYAFRTSYYGTLYSITDARTSCGWYIYWQWISSPFPSWQLFSFQSSISLFKCLSNSHALFSAWNALWPQERKRQRAFFLFGLALILQLDTEGIRTFFHSFFRLPKWLVVRFIIWSILQINHPETSIFTIFVEFKVASISSNKNPRNLAGCRRDFWARLCRRRIFCCLRCICLW